VEETCDSDSRATSHPLFKWKTDEKFDMMMMMMYLFFYQVYIRNICISPNTSSASATDSSSRCDLLILHTPEAQEWAEYIDRVVKPSLCGRSLLSYALSYQDRLPCSDHERFQRSECVLLLLTSSLLELLSDETLHGALKRLLQPPRSVVALLCGVSEEDVPAETFRHWAGWRKLHADDEPDVYISTILEAMADGMSRTSNT